MSKEAMKLALEALEVEDMACRYEKDPTPEHIAKAITALREALAEQKSGIKQVIELYDSPDQPEQEPVAMKFKIYKPTVPDPMRQGINNALLPWVYDQDRSSGFDASMWVTPVATLPPQRTWVGLTGSEITTSPPYSVTRDKGCFHAGALWAEAKLKEKNQ